MLFFVLRGRLPGGIFTPTPIKMHKVYEQRYKRDREGEEMGIVNQPTTMPFHSAPGDLLLMTPLRMLLLPTTGHEFHPNEPCLVIKIPCQVEKILRRSPGGNGLFW